MSNTPAPRGPVGLIGCGAMGGAVARRLLALDLHVVAFDADPSALDAAVRAGCAAATSSADVARRSSVVLISLPNGRVVESALLGSGGLIEGVHGALHVVDLSTIHPDETRSIGERLAAAGVAYVDCPVGRSTAHAERGQLLVMAGGQGDAIEQVRWLLNGLGEIVECGPLGSGSTVKLANNLCAQAILGASVEALAMAVAGGASADAVLRVLPNTAADNASWHGAIPDKVLPGDYTLGFKASLALKDVTLATSVLDAAAIDAPVSRGVREALTRLVDAGFADADVAAYGALFELSDASAPNAA